MRIIIILFCVLFSFSSFSQKDRKDYDTNYLKEFSHNFYPYTFTNIKNHNIYLSNLENESAWVNYSPNSPLYLGFGFDYKWATFSYAFPIQSKADKKGSNFNFFYGMSRRKFRFSLMYQQYQGFFKDDPNIPGDWFDHNKTLPFRADIKDYILQGTFFYIFNNRKVSYRSSFLYLEKQLKSAGSFTAGTNFNISGITSDSSLIPPKLDTSFGEEIKKQKVLDVNIGIKVGYIYTWVFHKNWHVSAHFSPTLYFNKDRLLEKGASGINVSNLEKSIFFGTDFRLVLGYDNDTYFGGLLFLNSNTKQDFTKSSFSTDYSVIELYFGKRMNLHFRKPEKRKVFD